MSFSTGATQEYKTEIFIKKDPRKGESDKTKETQAQQELWSQFMWPI